MNHSYPFASFRPFCMVKIHHYSLFCFEIILICFHFLRTISTRTDFSCKYKYNNNYISVPDKMESAKRYIFLQAMYNQSNATNETGKLGNINTW